MHDPGRVLVDLAVAVADGAECIPGVAVLADQPGLFGAVAPLDWDGLTPIASLGRADHRGPASLSRRGRVQPSGSTAPQKHQHPASRELNTTTEREATLEVRCSSRVLA